jgi:hypothetical protein
VTVVVALYSGAFVVSDPSTEAALLKQATWSPLLGVLGILFVQGVCSVAVIRYFLTEARDGFHPWKTLLAPILGACAMAGACYLLISNRAALSGAGDALFVKAIPWTALVMFLIGIVAAVYLRAKDTDRYNAIGKFAHEGMTSHDAQVSPELAPAST